MLEYKNFKEIGYVSKIDILDEKYLTSEIENFLQNIDWEVLKELEKEYPNILYSEENENVSSFDWNLKNQTIDKLEKLYSSILRKEYYYVHFAGFYDEGEKKYFVCCAQTREYGDWMRNVESFEKKIINNQNQGGQK